MIEFVSGKLEKLAMDHVVINCNGLAYFINISLQTRDKIKPDGSLKLYTHLSIKEDSHSLYGFMTEDERSMFRHLISVSGIGTNTARLVLSSLEAGEVANAILNEDEMTFKRVKGIGAKTAKRIILDLKDKMAKFAHSGEAAISLQEPEGQARNEAISALTSLGFNRAEASKACNYVLKEHGTQLTVEDLIRFTLKKLSS